MNEQPTHYIYGLIDPRDRKLRYVGRTDNLEARMRQHKHNRSRITSSKAEWLNALDKVGLIPKFVVLQHCSELEAEECERKWIVFCCYMGIDLVNGTGVVKGASEVVVNCRFARTHRMLGQPEKAFEYDKMSLSLLLGEESSTT